MPSEAPDSLSPWPGSLRVWSGSVQSLQRRAAVKGMTSPRLWELPRSALLSELASLPPPGPPARCGCVLQLAHGA